MIGALLLPLIFAGPIWIWRWRSGQALALSQVDARWWRAFAEYCIGYVLALMVFILLNGVPATRGLLAGGLMGRMGYFYLFLAGPLGVPALIFAVFEIRRRILARTAQA